MKQWIKTNPWLLLVLAIFISVGATYSLVIPPWQACDEPFHFLYAEKILQHGELPTREKNYEALHSPMYYGLLAAAALPIRDAGFKVHLYYFRFLTVLMGAASLLVLFALGKAAGLDAPASLSAVAITATIPMFCVGFSTVTNDSLAILLAWVASLIFCRAGAGIRKPGAIALCALVSGLAVTAKTNNIFIPLVFALFYLASGRHPNLKTLARDILLFTAIFIPTGLGWHIYAYHIYGNLVFGNPVNEIAPYSWWTAAGFIEWLRVLFGTFWMFVDFLRNRMDPRPPIGFYYFFMAATAVLCAGAIKGLAAKASEAEKRIKIVMFIFLAGCALTIAEVLVYNRVAFVAQARYTYPSLCGLALLWSWGIRKLFGKHAPAVAAAYVILALIINMLLLFFYVRLMPLEFFITPEML